MKKFFMTVVAAVAVAMSANAQVYVGGTAGINSVKVAGGDSELTFKVLPEVGYSLDDEWGIGASLGWSKGNGLADLGGQYIHEGNLTTTFEVNPYVRYTAVKGKYVNVFVDGGFGYKHYNGQGNAWNVGLKPGVAVNLDKFSFAAHVGFVGWKTYKAKGADKSSNAAGVDLDGNNISFSVYYNF